MVERLGWLIGLPGIVLALARVGRLLDGATTGPTWAETLAVAALLGGLVTWMLELTRPPRWVIWLVGTLGAAVVAMRAVDAPSMRLGLIPTSATFDTIGVEGEIALQLIRFGAAPVVAVSGVVALVAILFWGLGCFVAHGAMNRKPAIATIPPLIAYLQFATFDRRPPGLTWLVAFLGITAAALIVTAPSAHQRLGRARFTTGDLVPRRSSGLLTTLVVTAVVGGLTAGSALAAAVPESGLLAWRTNSGIGSGLYGSGAANIFVGLQQQLIDLSDDPVFYARVSPNAPPNRDLYWKLITLDQYDGQFWSASRQSFATGGSQRWERPDWTFQGPTVRMSARVQIAGLTGSFLPTIYSPVDLSSDEELISRGFRVREDGSVAVDLQVIDSWSYQFQADVPEPDVSALATSDGRLSPVFQAAVDAGEIELEPSSLEVPVSEAPDSDALGRPESLDSYVDLPPDVQERITDIAEELTRNATTPFEKALVLEGFFRDPDEFQYSTQVDTGHTTLDLVDWISNPESINYRTGYCEQFATAMGALGRALGIPSRVVLGFTPGEIQTQDDGSELIVVRERNSHAWVEMWMDGQGWVRFDPTPRGDGVNPSLAASEIGFDARAYIPAPDAVGGSQLPSGQQILPDRLADRGSEPVPDFGDPGASGRGFGNLPTWTWFFIPLAAAALAVPGLKWIRRRRRIARIPGGDVGAAWQEIVDRLVDLGKDVSPAETPLEIAGRSSELVPLARRYGEVAYGGRVGLDCMPEFRKAEHRLKEDVDRLRWTRSWLSTRSLLRRHI